MAVASQLCFTFLLVSLFHISWCTSPFGYKEFNHLNGETVKLYISIPTQNNYSTKLETVGEAIQLRQKLASLYNNGNDELIYLKIDINNTISITPSSFLFGSNFSDGLLDSVEGERNPYHPMCVYTSVTRHISAFLDLCTGIRGYFEHGQFVSYIQPVIARYSNTVLHTMITEINYNGSHHDPSELGKMVEEISHRSFDEHIRKRRSEEEEAFPERWIELYVVMDWDFRTKACYNNEYLCRRLMNSYLYPASILYKKYFNIALVVKNFRLFTEEDNQRHGLGVDKRDINAKSFHDAVEALSESTNDKSRRSGGNGFDIFLLLTKAEAWGDPTAETLSFSQYAGVCSRTLNYVVVNARDENEAMLGIMHEIIHSLGGKDCGSHIMAAGQCYMYFAGVYCHPRLSTSREFSPELGR